MSELEFGHIWVEKDLHIVGRPLKTTELEMLSKFSVDCLEAKFAKEINFPPTILAPNGEPATEERIRFRRYNPFNVVP